MFFLLKFWRACDDLHQSSSFAEFLQRLQLFANVHISTLPVHLDEQEVYIFRGIMTTRWLARYQHL